MSFKDFARKYFPLPHTKRAKPKGRKKRPTISGFHVGDLVYHVSNPDILRGPITYLNGTFAQINHRPGTYITANLRPIEAAE
jgi:hypothetical protein